MSIRKTALSDRIFRMLVRALPGEFRADYGREMECLFKDQRRDARRQKGLAGLIWLWLDTLLSIFRTAPLEHWQMLKQDSRYALRMMRGSPGFTGLAVLTLALGIGANTAIFSVVDAILLRPLPYPLSTQLVALHQEAPRAGVSDLGFSEKEILDYRSQNHTLQSLVEYHTMTFTLLGHEEPQRVQTGVVSPEFFDLFGVRPQLGRTFLLSDDQPGAQAVLVLSYDYWQRHFGGDPGIVGKVFQMNNRPHAVVGVLPPLPQYPNKNDVYMPTSACPFRSAPAFRADRSARMMSLFGRLKPGVSLDQAQTDLDVIARGMVRDYPETYPATGGFAVRASNFQEEITRNARPTLLILLCATTMVLLIACANVANLMLSRLLRRDIELAVRSALGASGSRLLRQMVTEGSLLAFAGGGLGLLLAAATLDTLMAFTARFTPRASEIHLDASMLWFTLIFSMLSGILLGSVPSLTAGENQVAALNTSGSRLTVGTGRRRMRTILAVAQVTISFVLLMGAGLMLRSLFGLQHVDPGFDPQNVLTARLSLNWTKYNSPERRREFGAAVLEKLEANPGVLAAAITIFNPLNENQMSMSTDVLIEGRPLQKGQVSPRVEYRVASPAYFRALGVPILTGRGFSSRDGQDATPAAIVNQSMARHQWGGENPLGKRVSLDHGKTWMTIVGVAGDAKQRGLDKEAGDELYQPFAQNPNIGALLVRSSRDPRSIERLVREAVHAIDPNQPVDKFQTLEAVRREALAPPRLTALLLGLFAALALVITATGVGGMLALSVSQRRQEFGIRMALGATAGSVERAVLREGLLIVLAGLALGSLGSVWLTQIMSGMLYGILPNDPATYLGVSVALLFLAGLACYIPARRVTSIHPIEVMR